MTNKELADVFFTEWENGKDTFTIKTSGSTGEPKSIELKRDWLVWSAINTKKAIKCSNNDSLFCCIPVHKIGGLMMLVRSVVWNIPIEIIEPNANPLLNSTKASIVSFTPFQCSNIINDPIQKNNLKTFKTVILGGGELSLSLEKQIQALDDNTTFYHSYGMTETCSHIALRIINSKQYQDYFTPFSDIEIKQNNLHCLEIKCPFHTNFITTNDVVELIDNNKFKMIGRSDFMINTGGIKLIPEYIEFLIEKNLSPKAPFAVSAIKDDSLGEKIVLLSTDISIYQGIDFNFLNSYSKYAIPKLLLPIDKIPLNETNKIDRKKIKNDLMKIKI